MMRNLCIAAAVLLFFPVYVRAENSSLLYKEGEKLALAGNLDEAGKIFQRTIELSPYFCLGHYGLGRVYLSGGGDIELAVKELQAAVRLDGSFAKAHFYLGMAYMFDRKYVAAIKSFAEAYNRDRSYVEALYNIAAVYDLIGDSVNSAVYFDKYRRKLEEQQEDFGSF